MARVKIAEIRKRKKECDWGVWRGPDFLAACIKWDDCKGCGAFEGEK